MRNRPKLISGLPSSGKSTLARKLGGKILEFDDIITKYGSFDELTEEKDFALQQFRLTAQFGNYNIIVDTFLSKKSRLNITSVLSIKPDIIVVKCPLAECLSRNSRRSNSMITNEDLVTLEWQFEPVSITEGFNSIYFYDSVKNVFYRRVA